MKPNQLYELRHEAGLTVAELAKKSRISLAYIRQAETGKVPLTWLMAERLALALDVPGDELVEAQR